MATVKDITAMCKAGQVHEAYELAKADLENNPSDLWTHKEVGWALYYTIKENTEKSDYSNLIEHLNELKSLDQLSIPQDSILFESILFKIAGYVKAHLAVTDFDTPTRLSSLFSILRDYRFEQSKGYSFLLSCFIKFENWSEMADFIDWWDLNNLSNDDYTPFKMDNGKRIMSVAERAFIAKSKALLHLNDRARIEAFLPMLDTLMEQHPEMTYPGYFYGKLLLSLGGTTEEALKVVIPFARKKATEFWVWQLLSDVFVNESEKQLACLLRAVHCNTQENFLGKVRIKLAGLYIQRNQLDLAKYQIDKVVQCYLSQGWHLPNEINSWIHSPWIESVSSSDLAPIDYSAITNKILYGETLEAIAVVTYFDVNSHKATLVFGKEKRLSQKLHFKVTPGIFVKINYITDSNDKPNLINAEKTKSQTDLDFAKTVEGTIRKRDDKDFAFLKTEIGDIFIAPNTVRKYNIQNNENVQSLIVYDYNKKKEVWSWTCVTIKKKLN